MPGTQPDFAQVEPLFAVPSVLTSTSLDDYFLDRAQRRAVQSYYDGPVKVMGSAGTGKSVVALHRAKLLAETGNKVLLCTHNANLAKRLEIQLSELCSPEFHGRVTVTHVKALAGELYQRLAAQWQLDASRLVEGNHVARQLDSLLDEVAGEDRESILREWEEFLFPRAITSIEEYLGLRRVGSRSPLVESQRRSYWKYFGQLRSNMASAGQRDLHLSCQTIADGADGIPDDERFDAVIVDECQDLSFQELRLLKALCRDPALLMVLADPAQRIFAPRQTLAEVGILCGGARTIHLKQGYRSTSQIAALAERVLAVLGTIEWDGTRWERALYSDAGPAPSLRRFPDVAQETQHLIDSIVEIRSRAPGHTIGVLVPCVAHGARLGATLQRRGILTKQIWGAPLLEPGSSPVLWQSYNSVKGMEFDVCFLPWLSAEHLQKGLVAPEAARTDPERIRMLLHVLLSRARSELHVSWSGTGTVPGVTDD